MLNSIYKQIKEKLKYVEIVNNVENIQWYNAQYEQAGWPFSAGLFVEFPDALQFDDISKMKRRSSLKIRIHVYHQNLQTTEGILDSDVENHESTAFNVLSHVDNFEPWLAGQQLSTKLIFRGWQHWHRYKGWMITFVDFECKKLL